MHPLIISLILLRVHPACIDSTTHPFGDTLRVVAFHADTATPPGSISSGYWGAFQVDSAGFTEILTTFVEVSEQEWHHGYSHVGGGDRTGWARLGTGEMLIWLVRPGGLATLTWPDGHVTFLVACRTGFPPPGAE
jgi:hypothetical protein